MTRRAQIQTTTTHERETRKPGSRTLDRANTKRRLGSRITLLALICATAAVDGYGQPAEVASAGAVSPVATRVIDRDTLLATGKNDLFDALASLLPGYVYPRPSIAEGSEHTQPASYRGFAPDQVAVLLNGVPWNTNAQFHRSHMVGHGSVGVDLNTLPMAAIARIEILEDGASYRYGSGAIGAVINVVLDEGPGPNRFSASWSQHRTSIEGVPKFIGFDPKSSSEFGLFSLENRGQAIDDGDGETLFLTGTWGFAIGDRGFLNLSAQYRQRDPTQRSGLDPARSTRRSRTATSTRAKRSSSGATTASVTPTSRTSGFWRAPDFQSPSATRSRPTSDTHRVPARAAICSGVHSTTATSSASTRTATCRSSTPTWTTASSASCSSAAARPGT